MPKTGTMPGVCLRMPCLFIHLFPGRKNLKVYTLPMIIFTAIGVVSLIVALLLKREDKNKNYGLEAPNIQK